MTGSRGGSRRTARAGSRARRGRLALIGQVALVAALVVLVVARVVPGWRHRNAGRPRGAPASAEAGPPMSAFAGSASCRSCHPAEYQLWWSSHHAQAERAIGGPDDRRAFDPPRRFEHGTQHTNVALKNGRHEIASPGRGDRPETLVAERVIGVAPLRQFLVPAAGGRWQATEVAYDPQRDDWFDVYGAEDRRPGEWGHWTGRGMNWNSMCASCHNTRLLKGYDAGADSFATRMAEVSVGCEACHGPMADHVRWRARHRDPRAADPTARGFSADRWLETCGSCHSRRAEITGRFVPGDSYDDHFVLSVVDGSETFYPDGQVHEEDYEYSAFLGSRMHAAGVVCADCHEPHAARVRAPGNLLCMRCHDGRHPGAPVVDPAAHALHRLDPAYLAPGGPDTVTLAHRDPEQVARQGGECVNCHMPQTFYMQRHRRHDHGFTIPDPLLTRRYGIPNACNRCHGGRDAAWALRAVERGYGAKMERPTRQRAEILARARRGDVTVADSLVTRLGSERSPYWRAAAAALLGSLMAGSPGGASAGAALAAATRDPSPLVRAYAAMALEPAADGDPAVRVALEPLVGDPIRDVRYQAAWALRASLAPTDPAAAETRRILEFAADEPLGRMRVGAWQVARGALDSAAASYRVAASWDTNSAPLRHDLAIVLARLGRNDEAVVELLAACRHEPRVAEYPFKLGLAWNEVGRQDLAIAAFRDAVRLDPGLARAWYDLGLALEGEGRSAGALQALERAERADSRTPDAPYARATILVRLGRREEARRAASEALKRHPGYPPAEELLASLR